MTTSPHTILLIMTDQQRADMCAREGFAIDCTPRLDALARAGCWFDRAYTTAPVCVPARISMLTGRFPSAHGVRENHGYDSPRYQRDLFGAATDAGYRTALIGKNHSHLTADRADVFSPFGHLGRTPPAPSDEPEGRFDAWLRDLGAMTARQPAPHPVGVQNPARIVDEAIDWLDAEPAKPALAWLSIPEPHVPYQVPEPYFSDFGPDTVPAPVTEGDSLDDASLPWRWVRRLGQALGESDRETILRARANYVGMLKLIDDQIGRLLDHLERTGRLESTLIVFTADHGDFAGEYGLLRKGPGLPEVLTRVPMFFSGAGVASAGATASTAHVSLVDIYPTICELAGWAPGDGVQGRSLAPILRAEQPLAGEFDSIYAEQGVGGLPYPDDGQVIAAAFGDGTGAGVDDTGSGDGAPGSDVPVATLCDVTQNGAIRMARAGRWKLLMQVTGETSLFDLETDPLELHDRYDDPDCAETVRLMLEHLSRWLIRAADPLPIPADGYRRTIHPRNYHWSETR